MLSLARHRGVHELADQVLPNRSSMDGWRQETQAQATEGPESTQHDEAMRSEEGRQMPSQNWLVDRFRRYIPTFVALV